MKYTSSSAFLLTLSQCHGHVNYFEVVFQIKTPGRKLNKQKQELLKLKLTSCVCQVDHPSFVQLLFFKDI